MDNDQGLRRGDPEDWSKQYSSRTISSSSSRLWENFHITRWKIYEPWPSLMVWSLLPWTFFFFFCSELYWHPLCFIKCQWHTTLSVFFLHQYSVEQHLVHNANQVRMTASLMTVVIYQSVWLMPCLGWKQMSLQSPIRWMKQCLTDCIDTVHVTGCWRWVNQTAFETLCSHYRSTN